MSAVAASPLDLEIAKVLHAALGMLLARHGVTPISNPKPLLYSPKEAAVRLGLESVNQLYRRTSDGTWPYTPIGGLTKFSESDLEQIIKIQARDTAKKSNRKSALA